MGVRLLVGDCRAKLRELEAESVHACVTSPPYFGLRDYKADGQIGLEATPDAFVAELVDVFREVRRVLRDDGTLWLNLGDSYVSSPAGNRTPSGISQTTPKRVGAELSAYNTQPKSYAGLREKNLIGIPWRAAFALQADGWWLRQDIIWAKPNPMPESVTDRCTKSHEYIFLLSKSPRYYFDAKAIKEPGQLLVSGNTQHKYVDGDPRNRTKAGFLKMRGEVYENVNKRDVWTVTSEPYKGAHFATFPPALIKPCILAGCPEGGVVLDPFSGAGTTGMVADRLQRNAVLIEINPDYADLAHERLSRDAGLFSSVEAA